MNTVQVKMALITMKTKVGNQNLLIRHLVTHGPTQFKVRFTLFGVKFHFPSTGSSLWAFAERGQVIIQATVTMNKIQ